MNEEKEESTTRPITLRTADNQRLKLRCPLCGSEEWSQASPSPGVENFQPVLTANTKNGVSSLPVTQLFCGNCGYAVAFGPAQGNDDFEVIING